MSKRIKSKFILMLILIASALLIGCTEEAEYVTDYDVTELFNADAENTITYTGNLKDGIPSGFGVLNMFDDEGNEITAIKGNFVNGVIQGEGKSVSKAYGTMKGEYVDGNLTKGIYYLPDGMKLYDGEFKFYEGMTWLEGDGKTYNKNGDLTYVGEFKKGIPTDKKVAYSMTVDYSYEDLCKEENAIYNMVQLEGNVIEVLSGNRYYRSFIINFNYLDDRPIYISDMSLNQANKINVGDKVILCGRFEHVISFGEYEYLPYINNFFVEIK